MPAVAAVVCAALAVPAIAQFPAPAATNSLAPYVPTPQDVVDRMLSLANVTASDVVYDLGCGDGRIVVTAAKKFGAQGVGVDFDPDRIKESEANAKAAGVEHLVSFKLQDAMTVDVSPATVVTLYLLSSSNAKLRPDPDPPAQTRRPHRVARLQHGRLDAGEDRPVHRQRRHATDPLPLDHRRQPVRPWELHLGDLSTTALRSCAPSTAPGTALSTGHPAPGTSDLCPLPGRLVSEPGVWPANH